MTENVRIKGYYKCTLLLRTTLCPVNVFHEKKDDRQNDRPVRKQVSARHKEEGHYSALKAYADKRLDKCVFGEEKPACKQCPVHCYQPARREEMKQVMRWAGPRMLWRHPILTIRHLIDDRRPVPELPEKYRPKK